MPATPTDSPLTPQNPAESLRTNTCRYARYAETHPVQPLKGLRETRAASVSYQALPPYGATLPFRISAIHPVVLQFILNSEFLILNWTYTFSAKEKDSETGLSVTSLRSVSSSSLSQYQTSLAWHSLIRRFGSRYYSSDLSIWLSVDPMSDKYPSLSPYVYCADNPVKLVDPDGEEVVVSGSGSEDVKTQINNMTSKNFKVSLGSDGKMTYSGKAKTKTDKFVKNAIDRSDITINIVAENDKKSFTSKTDGKKYDYQKEDDGITCTGAYGGSEYVNGHAISYQYVDPNRSAKLDDAVGDNVSGGYMLHEFAEGYYSADIALHNKRGDPISLRNNYGVAHNRANAISGGDWKYSTEYMTLPNGLKMQTYSGLRRSPTY